MQAVAMEKIIVTSYTSFNNQENSNRLPASVLLALAVVAEALALVLLVGHCWEVVDNILGQQEEELVRAVLELLVAGDNIPLDQQAEQAQAVPHKAAAAVEKLYNIKFHQVSLIIYEIFPISVERLRTGIGAPGGTLFG